MKAAITKTNRSSSGKLIDYVLTLEDGSEIQITSNDIKEKIRRGELEVAGMKLDATGRLVKAGKDAGWEAPARTKKTGAGAESAGTDRGEESEKAKEKPGAFSTAAADKAPAVRPKAFVKVKII